MKNHFLKNATKMLLIPTLIVGGLSACGYNDNNGARTNMYNGARTNMYDGAGTYNYNGNMNYANNNYANQNNGTRVNQKAVQRVENIAENIPGVQRATAIVYGNDIVIGIDANSRKNTNALERKVHQAVKSNEPNYNVHVTTDRNIHTRIRTLDGNMNNYNTNTRNAVNSGHPVRDLGTDVSMIIRDIGRTVTAPFR